MTKSFREGDVVWLFEAREAKFPNSFLPRRCPFEVLNRTSEVTDPISHCKIEEKWQKLKSNHLQSTRGDPERRQLFRRKRRPPPIHELLPNVVQLEEDSEDRPLHVFEPTKTKAKSACNRLQATFRLPPEIVEQMSISEREKTVHV